MTKLTESAIENFAIKLFERLGYSYVYAPDIAPDGDRPERSRYDEVLLIGRLAQALKRISLLKKSKQPRNKSVPLKNSEIHCCPN
ncbi:MAG: type I restriction endonuclease [Candidatus Nitrotoga sp.]